MHAILFMIRKIHIPVCNAAELIIIFIYTIPQKPLILHMYQGIKNATHNTALYQGICMNEQSDELFSHCFLNIVWNFDVFSLEWHRYMNKKITIDVTTFLEHYLAKTLTWSIKFWVILKKPTISFYFQGKHFLILKVSREQFQRSNTVQPEYFAIISFHRSY